MERDGTIVVTGSSRTQGLRAKGAEPPSVIDCVSITTEALDRIGALHGNEREARGQSVEQRRVLRHVPSLGIVVAGFCPTAMSTFTRAARNGGRDGSGSQHSTKPSHSTHAPLSPGIRGPKTTAIRRSSNRRQRYIRDFDRWALRPLLNGLYDSMMSSIRTASTMGARSGAQYWELSCEHILPPMRYSIISEHGGNEEFSQAIIESSETVVRCACHERYHLVSQRSIDSAPLPLKTMTKRTARSNTKYSIPSPFFDPNQFTVHPSGR